MKSSDAQFKQNMDSITYDDVLKMREMKSKHPIDLNELNISLKTANDYVEVIKDWLSQLNFSSDRIDSFECRGRDGFIPSGHNNGGLEGIAYQSQYSACENTGFENTDTVLTKGYAYDLECYLADNKLPKDVELTEDQLEAFHNYQSESDDTIQYQARVMFTSETTVNVDFYISASDSPYHRHSDDRLELELKFRTPNGLKRQLTKILKNPFVSRFARQVSEGY